MTYLLIKVHEEEGPLPYGRGSKEEGRGFEDEGRGSEGRGCDGTAGVRSE